jgi:hypothetical protein
MRILILLLSLTSYVTMAESFNLYALVLTSVKLNDDWTFLVIFTLRCNCLEGL